jgi:hypothetical protein
MLSIDIDGDDYWVLKALEKTPRVVILEYHCGIDNNVPVAIVESGGDVKSHETPTYLDYPLNGYYGANMIAFYKLMKSKGYQFVTSIVDNAIFVHDSEFPKLGIAPIDEATCIEKYFNPHHYWGVSHRDIYDREWILT